MTSDASTTMEALSAIFEEMLLPPAPVGVRAQTLATTLTSLAVEMTMATDRRD